jgi:hypothetical protein
VGRLHGGQLQQTFSVSLDAPAEEVQALIDVGDRCLLRRQAQAIVARAVAALSRICSTVGPLALDQQNPIVGVPGQPEDRTSLALPSRKGSVLAGPPVEVLVEHRQSEVGEQR